MGRAALLLLLSGVATAAEPAHYHPDDVAKASGRFGAVAERIGPAFQARQDAIASVGVAVARLELGTALLGAAAPAELTAWNTSTRKRMVGERLRLQRHVDLLQDDYAKVFGAAVERALPTVGRGYAVDVCGASGVLAMMGRKNCAGKDLNPVLAAAIDADAALQKELADIASVEWPSFEAPKAAQPVVALSGTARWVDGGRVAEALISAHVADRKEALEAELERILPDEPTEADVKKAQAKKDAYLAALAGDGEVLRAALTGALGRAEKKGGPAQVGWCANPPELGGCAGDDVTGAVVEIAKADKKLQKELGSLGG